MRKRIRIMGILLVFSFLLFGCTEEKKESENRLTIGILCYDINDTFLGELTECLKTELSALRECGILPAVRVCDAASSQRRQNDQVKSLIQAGCQILCVNLVDRAEPSEIIDAAREAGVPVIFFNREPVEEDLLQWEQLYYVGAAARQSGIMEGELAADYIKSHPNADRNQDGKIQYIVLEGEAGHQDAIIRTESAVETLKKQNIGLEKLGGGTANWSRAQAQNRMKELMGLYPNQIEMVLANNDAMALGAMDVCRELGITESSLPVFFGIDGTKEGLEAVRDGILAGTVYNDKEGQARTMSMLVAAVFGYGNFSDIPLENGHCVYLPYEKVTKENVDQWKGGE